MKINAIKRICLDEGECVIYNDEETGEQWIGTTSACYPVDSGRIAPQDIAGLFDMKKEKADAMTICEEDWQTCGIRPMPWTESGMQAYRCREWVRMFCRGELVDVVSFAERVYVIKVSKRNAVKIEEPYAGIYIAWERNGMPVFLIFSGFVLAGIIRPEPVETSMQALKVVEDMKFLKAEHEDEKPTSEQTTMLEDEP